MYNKKLTLFISIKRKHSSIFKNNLARHGPLILTVSPNKKVYCARYDYSDPQIGYPKISAPH